MADTFGRIVGGSIELIVRLVVVPVTGVIPRLASSGILFATFGAMWGGVAIALVVDPAALTAFARTIQGLPLPLVAVAWLLFLPVTAGLWIWTTDWPLAFRLALLGGLAVWTLLVMKPARDPHAELTPSDGTGAGRIVA